MNEEPRHLWITGTTRAERSGPLLEHRPDVAVDCHRRRFGPYTGVGSLLRALLPQLGDWATAEAAHHRKEVLAVAPELADLLGAVQGNLTVTVPELERTRWFPASTTRRQSQGLIDLLRVLTAPDGPGRPLTLALDSVHEADPTDLEFLTLALRRLDPARVRLVVAGAEAEWPPELAAASELHTRQLLAAGPGPVEPPQPGGPVDAARAFIASDGTSDDPALIAGYAACDPALRASLHDERAKELTADGPLSARFGALPWHRTNGGAPASETTVAVAEAAAQCIGAAHYAAGLHLVEPLVERTDPLRDPDTYYYLKLLVAQCLGALSRPEETEDIYWDLLSRTNRPKAHMSIYYALGIIYTRLYDPEHKDHRRARAFMNTSIELAKLLPDADDRAFHTVFMGNGKALVDMHLRNPQAALTLVENGIALLDRELTPDQHRLHRSVLHHNRSQLLVGLGRLDEAAAELDQVIAVDPMYPEYRFDRGNVRCRQGRPEQALLDYDDAARLGPPFPELFHNRGQARADSGDLSGAAADFSYVLDLEPDHLEGRISLASLLLDTGDATGAVRIAAEGIALTPEEARLHCSLGLALLELDRPEQASAAFDRALELDPELTAARVNRAVADYQRGRFGPALDDLTTALERDADNPDLLYNRGFVHEALQQWEESVADYGRALRAEGADRSELLYRRGVSLAAAGRRREADADLRAHLALGDSPYQEEVEALLAQQQPAR